MMTYLDVYCEMWYYLSCYVELETCFCSFLYHWDHVNNNAPFRCNIFNPKDWIFVLWCGHQVNANWFHWSILWDSNFVLRVSTFKGLVEILIMNYELLFFCYNYEFWFDFPYFMYFATLFIGPRVIPISPNKAILPSPGLCSLSLSLSLSHTEGWVPPTMEPTSLWEVGSIVPNYVIIFSPNSHR